MKVSKTNRFSNHLILKEIGGHGQKLLNESRVLIIGLGGLGCPVLQYAAGSGIGTIGLIDNDNIEVSNLHRQTIFSTNDIGKSKVEVAEKVTNMINPETKTLIYKERLDDKNASKIINTGFIDLSLPLPPKINAKEAKDEMAAAKTALTVAIKISLFNI